MTRCFDCHSMIHECAEVSMGPPDLLDYLDLRAEGKWSVSGCGEGEESDSYIYETLTPLPQIYMTVPRGD
jgi:hypothetical protein